MKRGTIKDSLVAPPPARALDRNFSARTPF